MRADLRVALLGFLLAGNACFNRAEFSPPRLALTVTPTSVPADGSTAATLEIVLTGYLGPEAGATVPLYCSGACDLSSVPPTDTQGITRATVRSTTVGTQAIVARYQSSTGGAAATASVTFTEPPATPPTPSRTYSSLTALPPVIVADGIATSSLLLVVVDGNNVPMPNQAVSITASGSNNTLTHGAFVTDGNGVFGATLSSITAEVKDITATCAGVTFTTQVTATAGSESNVTSSLVASPNSVTADGASIVLLTTTVRDVLGNPLSNANITLSGSGTHNTFTPGSGVTDASGVFTAQLTSTLAQAERITALGTGFSLNTNVTFVHGPPTSATSSFVANPNVLTADGTTVSNLTVTLLDVTGNPVPNQNVTLAVVVGSNYTLMPAPGPTNAQGVFTGTLTSTQAETKVVTATAGSLVQSANVVFAPGAPSGSSSTLVASPNTQTADGVSTIGLTVSVVDNANNPVPGVAIDLTAGGGNTVFSPSSGLTNASGIFTASATSTLAQVEMITASSSGFSANTNVTFVAGPPSANGSYITINPNQTTADGTSFVRVTAFIGDAYGNPVANAAVTFAANGNNNTFSPTATGNTTAAGTFDALLRSTLAQVETVTATSSGVVTANGSVVFQAGSPNTTNSTFTASPNLLMATSNATLTVTLRDAFNNNVPNAAVTFSSASGNLSFGSPTGSTNGAGVFTGSLTSSTVQTVQVTASGATYSLNANVTFNAGETSFALSGMDLFLGVGQSSGATVTALTAQGNVATLYTGTITFTSSDPAATLNVPYTFTALDAGKHTFPSAITVQTIGSQSLTVTDANGTTGTEPDIVVSAYVVDGVYIGEDSDSACAQMSNQQLKCWGLNPNGELGYGDHQTRGTTASTLGANLPFVSLGSGRSVVKACTNGSDAAVGHACAVLDDGNVTCWGGNSNGQLGYGDVTERPQPTNEVSFGGPTAQSVRCGFGTTCVLLSNGQVMCWGLNRNGQLGMGDFNDRLQPTTLNAPPSRTWADIELGTENTCGVLDNLTVTCWGENTNGELGYGDTLKRSSPPSTPLALAGGNQAMGVALGGLFTCAVLPNQQVTCWGANNRGQLGLGDTVPRLTSSSTITFPGHPSIASVGAGGSGFACALTTTGSVYCWGYGADGELGLGDSTNQSIPTAAANLGSQRTATSIAAGNIFSCAILDNKTSKCWGGNYHGYLGLGDVVNRGDSPNTMGDTLPVTKLW